MPNITIEYTIMVPILLIQVFLFPIAVNVMTLEWTDARRQNALQDAADHLGSMIQQLYFCLNQERIAAGNVTQASTLPPTIESYPYNATGSMSSQTLLLILRLQKAGNTATATVKLGPNAKWDPDSPDFRSDSPTASIKVEKIGNGTLLFSFG